MGPYIKRANVAWVSSSNSGKKRGKGIITPFTRAIWGSVPRNAPTGEIGAFTRAIWGSGSKLRSMITRLSEFALRAFFSRVKRGKIGVSETKKFLRKIRKRVL